MDTKNYIKLIIIFAKINNTLLFQNDTKKKNNKRFS